MKTSAKYFAEQLGLRAGNMSQNDAKTTLVMMSLTKNLHPQPKNFFRVQTRRLADQFDTLRASVQYIRT